MPVLDFVKTPECVDGVGKGLEDLLDGGIDGGADTLDLGFGALLAADLDLCGNEGGKFERATEALRCRRGAGRAIGIAIDG